MHKYLGPVRCSLLSGASICLFLPGQRGWRQWARGCTQADATSPRHCATSRPTVSLCTPCGNCVEIKHELVGSCLLLAVRIKIKLPPLSHLSSCPCLGVAESKAPPGHAIPAFITGQGTAGGRGMGTTGSAFPLPFGGPKPRSLKPFLTPGPKAG